MKCDMCPLEGYREVFQLNLSYWLCRRHADWFDPEHTSTTISERGIEPKPEPKPN